MAEVIAVFNAESAADVAVRDLEAARISSATIRREVRGDLDFRDESGQERTQIHGRPAVTVAVDDVHSELVTGIPDQYTSLDVQEYAA